MRLWTIHPRYLDAKGLVALWREGLLAQKVLQGKTKGYKNHPQLIRFRSHPRPEAAVAFYLFNVLAEAKRRGYSFDSCKISGKNIKCSISETKGQLLYEWKHLKRKLKNRDYKKYLEIRAAKMPDAHPLFHIAEGRVRNWEKIR